jgi:MraZ protein
MSVVAQPFMSTVTGTLDSKGRVCIPAAYRQILTAQNTNGVLICPTFFEPHALEGFGQTLLEALHERLSKLDPFFSTEHDDDAYAIISRTQALPADEQGRVRLPDPLISHAGLTDKVVFVGLSSKFQIWNPERFADMDAERIARVRARRERELAKQSGGGQ